MSTNLKQHWKLLESIARNRNCRSRRTHLKQVADDESFHRCMREICHNVVKRKVPIGLKDVKKLFKFKKSIREIAKKRTTKHSRKQHIIQGGAGFLPLLIPIISSLLAGVLGK